MGVASLDQLAYDIHIYGVTAQNSPGLFTSV